MNEPMLELVDQTRAGIGKRSLEPGEKDVLYESYCSKTEFIYEAKRYAIHGIRVKPHGDVEVILRFLDCIPNDRWDE